MTLLPIATVSYYTYEGPGTGGNYTDNIYVDYTNEDGKVVRIEDNAAMFDVYGDTVCKWGLLSYTLVYRASIPCTICSQIQDPLYLPSLLP